MAGTGLERFFRTITRFDLDIRAFGANTRTRPSGRTLHGALRFMGGADNANRIVPGPYRAAHRRCHLYSRPCMAPHKTGGQDRPASIFVSAGRLPGAHHRRRGMDIQKSGWMDLQAHSPRQRPLGYRDISDPQRYPLPGTLP